MIKKLIPVIILIIGLSSCSVLYRKDACGNRPVLIRVHVVEPNLSR